MCKCCQSIFESIYWHCFEKHWCYDDDIALYEEPGLVPTISEEKNSEFAFDNMAFYDSVAVIAGRSIVTIQPLSSETKPFESKSPIAIAWKDDDKVKPKRKANVLPVINQLKMEAKIMNVPQIPISQMDGAMLKPEDTKRRPSLQQRRMSKMLTLRLESGATELPIIRQNSMPKFYLDTPEPNQNDSSILRTPSMALTSPVVPKNSDVQFDLRSVVHHETQSKLQHAVSQASMIAQIRDKFKKPLLRKQASNPNIPTSINHM